MLRYLTSGESHGPQLTAIIEGFPAGFPFDVDRLNEQMARRQVGFGRGGRMKIETDTAVVVSGVRHGYTLGSPITLVVINKDFKAWTESMAAERLPDEVLGNIKRRTLPRPGHADLPGAIKMNHSDLRNVLERASARETAARTAVGSFARQLLEHFGVNIVSHVVSIGGVSLPSGYDISNLDKIRELTSASDVRCIDPEVDAGMMEQIQAAFKNHDTLGGVAEVIIRGLPVGLGGFAQSSDRLDGQLAGAMMSIQSVKGVEIGLGYRGAATPGSEYHDEIFYSADGDPVKKRFHRETNRAGGIEGGITNGEDVIVRVVAKPISTLSRPLKSVDILTHEPGEAFVERSDKCVVPALAVICEAVAAWELATAFLKKFGSDNLAETERNYRSFLDTTF
jgi:chorismate synthase